MSFTVEDFHDLIELLAQHPEWRAELRRHVLSDELLELPALVQRLVDAQVRTEARLERLEATVQSLAEAQARAEARLERVESRLENVESRLERVEEGLDRVDIALATLAEAQARTEARLGRVEDRLGELDGDVMELHNARRGLAYLSPIARRLRAVETGQLAELLDDAVDGGQLTEDERGAVMLADVVFSGRRRDDGQEIYLLAEVSSGVGSYDVDSAAERAALLQKLGRPVLPVVAGRWINDEAAELAQQLGVWYALGGRVTAPRPA